jgi:hypothetical protein
MTSGRSPPPVTRTEAEGETPDMPEGIGALAAGQVLGERYQTLEVLGCDVEVVVL